MNQPKAEVTAWTRRDALFLTISASAILAGATLGRLTGSVPWLVVLGITAGVAVIETVALETVNRFLRRRDDASPVLCAICQSDQIMLVRETYPTIVSQASLRASISGYCRDHATGLAETEDPAAYYWLPWTRGGITLGGVLDDLIVVEQPGCCHCGGRRGPAAYVVWGEDDGPDWGEGYCAVCMLTPTTWLPGSTCAHLGSQYTIDDFQDAAAAAWESRGPITTRLAGIGSVSGSGAGSTPMSQPDSDLQDDADTTVAYVDGIPDCHWHPGRPAVYDAIVVDQPTQPFADMCQVCMDARGPDRLGAGLGQRYAIRVVAR